MLLFEADIKLAGTLSLAVSLPTMPVGFARQSRSKLSVVGRNKAFHFVMATDSIVGTLIGGLLLGVVPDCLLLPANPGSLGDESPVAFVIRTRNSLASNTLERRIGRPAATDGDCREQTDRRRATRDADGNGLPDSP